MKAKVRICQVGCGYWGSNIARNLAASDQVVLAALCDADANRLQQFARRYGVDKTYGRLDEALADPQIDAIFLVTPSGQHYAQTRAALEAGKHVFVEKPLADSTAQAADLARLADAMGRTLMVGHTFLYNNLVHAVKAYIDSGELGEILYAYSQRLNLGRFRTDSDVLWTLAPHDISIVNYWFGDRPVRVSARGRSYIHKRRGIAEVCFAELEYASGQSAQFHLSWLDPQKRREMVVVGSRKMLVYDDMNSDAHIRLYDKRAEAQHQSEAVDFADFTTRLRAGDLVIPNVRLVEPLAAEIAHFTDCVGSGAAPRTDGWHGVEVVAVLEAMTQSMQADGSTVQVAYPAAAALEPPVRAAAAIGQ
jgi:predicted dehydrogenase